MLFPLLILIEYWHKFTCVKKLSLPFNRFQLFLAHFKWFIESNHCLSKRNFSFLLPSFLAMWKILSIHGWGRRFITPTRWRRIHINSLNDSNFVQLPDWYNLFYGIWLSPSYVFIPFRNSKDTLCICVLTLSIIQQTFEYTHTKHTFRGITHLSWEIFLVFTLHPFFVYFTMCRKFLV